jgi:23S rRNA (adenine2503-C2)-methyltransferase
MMRVIGMSGKEDIAIAHIAEIADGRCVEFVESVQPPLPRSRKWVLIVSTMFGCPVGCLMCDAGGSYRGNLSKDEILAQIDFMVRRRFPEGKVQVDKFKVQFARMGEPSLNMAVLEVLEELPLRYCAPGLIPSVSTVAPTGCEPFLERLTAIKGTHYSGGRFQLQFSVHTTDQAMRDKLVPTRKWNLEQMAAFGARFYCPGDRKITLNFALAEGVRIAPGVLRRHFDPERFLVKITPVNPTYAALQNGIASYITSDECEDREDVIGTLRQAGYEVIVSIGELEENLIGSNCGQYVMTHLRAREHIGESYTYKVLKS